MKVFFLVLFLSLPNILWASEDVLIEDSALVSQLNIIHNGLAKVSSAVMNCLDSGKEHPVCLCQNKSIIIEFNNTVKSLLENSTKLQNLDLVRFKHADGEWVTLSLQNLKKQASKEPSCT